MSYHHRVMEGALKRALTTFPVAFVGGPRQAGKTTLLRHALDSKFRYINLEDPSERLRFSQDPRGYLEALGSHVLFDEVQYAPSLMTYLKVRIDADRKAGSYALTGSQSLSVMQGVSQSLAGRVAVLDLLPLGLEEARPGRSARATLKDLLKVPESPGKRPGQALSLADWVLRGTYPELRFNRKVDRQAWLSSYIQTYMERDVRSLLKVGDLNTFERFLRLCAARTGQELNLAQLGRDTGVSLPTAKAWLSVLEASHLVFLLQPWFENYGKRLVKAPKLYFYDTALACFLMDIHSPEGLMRGPAAGPLFETAVVSDWRKAFKHRGLLPSLYWWRSNDGIEVDLLIQWDGQLHAMEIKLTTDPTPVHAAGLQRWGALSGAKAATCRIIHGGDRLLAVAPGIAGVPWLAQA